MSIRSLAKRLAKIEANGAGDLSHLSDDELRHQIRSLARDCADSIHERKEELYRALLKIADSTGSSIPQDTFDFVQNELKKMLAT